MGQLAAKLKEFVEKLEWNNEHTSRTRDALSTHENNENVPLLRDTRHDKQTSTDEMYKEDRELLQKVLGKLELIETVVEIQRQTIEEHGTKIRALRNSVKTEEKKDENRKDEVSDTQDSEGEKDSTLGRIFDSIFQDKSKTEDLSPSELLKQHSEVLRTQEEKLQSAMKKIDAINEIVEDGKGSYKRNAEIQETLKGMKTTLEKLKRDHDAFKKENHEQLDLHQKLLDNLFSGFVVAFLIVVFVCMFTK